MKTSELTGMLARRLNIVGRLKITMLALVLIFILAAVLEQTNNR